MPNGHDDDDNGSSTTGNLTGKRTGNRRASNRDATIGVIRDDNDNADGKNTGIGSGAESATGESRTGDAVPLFASIRSDSGTGTGKRRSNSGDSGSGSAGSATGPEEIEIGITGAIPRKVKNSELGVTSKKNKSDVSPEFLAECWQLMFGGVASFVKDSEWKIDDDDASELGTRTAKLINSLDPKKSGKWIKRFQKHQPALSLAFAVAMIATPRIKSTREKRKNGNLQAKDGSITTGNRSAGSPIQNAGDGNSGMVEPTVAATGRIEVDTNTGFAGVVGIPISKQDAAIQFGRTKSGKM